MVWTSICLRHHYPCSTRLLNVSSLLGRPPFPGAAKHRERLTTTQTGGPEGSRLQTRPGRAKALAPRIFLDGVSTSSPNQGRPRHDTARPALSGAERRRQDHFTQAGRECCLGSMIRDAFRFPGNPPRALRFPWPCLVHLMGKGTVPRRRLSPARPPSTKISQSPISAFLGQARPVSVCNDTKNERLHGATGLCPRKVHTSPLRLWCCQNEAPFLPTKRAATPPQNAGNQRFHGGTQSHLAANQTRIRDRPQINRQDLPLPERHRRICTVQSENQPPSHEYGSGLVSPEPRPRHARTPDSRETRYPQSSGPVEMVIRSEDHPECQMVSPPGWPRPHPSGWCGRDPAILTKNNLPAPSRER